MTAAVSIAYLNDFWCYRFIFSSFFLSSLSLFIIYYFHYHFIPIIIIKYFYDVEKIRNVFFFVNVRNIHIVGNLSTIYTNKYYFIKFIFKSHYKKREILPCENLIKALKMLLWPPAKSKWRGINFRPNLSRYPPTLALEQVPKFKLYLISLRFCLGCNKVWNSRFGKTFGYLVLTLSPS